MVYPKGDYIQTGKRESCNKNEMKSSVAVEGGGGLGFFNIVQYVKFSDNLWILNPHIYTFKRKQIEIPAYLFPLNDKD